ncbi:MAG: proline--tRNA ligase [Candidatus Cloacimonadales bacterium]|jgi:prolyl-tRNA synthetase|nr:proline--tRNA ligase [Candidatus Cloacimonadota bacterium]MDY0380980.1 proline--tRNA ligase [Candidatus Cloacimonadaceae bacterium]HCM16285.1 proline--tRNA ligase [Candidatus Cloacimonas sp.]MCB5256880.1 proline--tRNA ligase [Candidatus Cloacimonadota bacterium]MCB5264462.1 proline--tRNA ligase [Candidatus Cloacimonadota bacterium]
MSKQKKTAIEPTREQNYAEWYQQVIKNADLAENSDVRGCMVIKPWGYAIWENIQRALDTMFRETGHRNAYFPLFIPKSYFEKEAEHVEGFAKECAVVTHSRLEDDGNGGLMVAGELTEPLIVRPTSETIIGASFAKWVNSYRDLPLLINQWANIVRWEMRTRLFLRTAEFLWQEGHTVHETAEDAMEETRKMLEVYARFAAEYLALPVIMGEKTEGEKFPGAVNTYCIEAMMQDKKALQAGTSHFLGQNFAKSSGIKFQGRNGEFEFAWTTSWGVSTRLIGALIMAHSDDNGLALPPKIAPSHIAIIPIYRDENEKSSVLAYCDRIQQLFAKEYFEDIKIYCELDDRDLTGSERNWYWIKKGIPIRLEIGPRDIESDAVMMARRDKEPRDKQSVGVNNLRDYVLQSLKDIQDTYYQRALSFREANTVQVDDNRKFYKFFTAKNAETPEIHGGFAESHWCGDVACEEKIKEDLKVTIRCIPFDAVEVEGRCICCGKPSRRRVIFAKSY